MLELTPHLSRDAFQVRYDPSRVTVQRMLDAIKDCGFTGRESKPLDAAASRTVDAQEFPAALREALSAAGAGGKLVLLNFHGAG